MVQILSYAMMKKLCGEFKLSRDITEDDPQSGWSKTSTTDEQVVV